MEGKITMEDRQAAMACKVLFAKARLYLADR